MIKLVVLAVVIVVGLMYFNVIDLGDSNDRVQDIIDEQVEKVSDASQETFQEFKEDTKKKYEDFQN